MKGFQFHGIDCGIKKQGLKDLGVIFSTVPASAAAVFTKNRVVAAPVELGREKIKSGQCQAIVVNSGNANCFTGEQGIEDAEETAKLMGQALNISPRLVQVSSTGVIGAPMPMHRIRDGVPRLVNDLKKGSINDFAESILTTDTCIKVVSRSVKTDRFEYTLTGVAKGSGMIQPNMATMLAFVCTDAGVDPGLLQTCLKDTCDRSFNRITVDGDTSTNDTVFCLANGLSQYSVVDELEIDLFQNALDHVCIELSKAIVRDGEGATKLVKINVTHAPSPKAAYQVAYAISHSNLVKTAVYGEDPNWGRITAAAGRSGADVDPGLMDLYFDDICLVKKGLWQGNAIEQQAAQIMKKDELTITLDLNCGECHDYFYFCDFSEDYVRINADYRT
ncbi:MAG: bifunctional glutamate N-acetyltransferase/amino-acid acetyltransferase ArgJ [Desulfobacteraceae bacterium]|nr:MAG: bifunctional glutamate N-acetyltransferase/amino-acid acetyltransferase ArgJ [Desulfobacteraceae bacterium]